MIDIFASGHHPPAQQSLMELDSVLMLIERIGLPAVIIGACFYYIMKSEKRHDDEIRRWEEKDTIGDARLIEVIKEQNARSENVAQAMNDLSVTNKDVAKTNERLAMEIKGMGEALIRNR
tara:strand:+ start:290 stop:649 length:360 start_codon:yes stop_codon:yes gene_type:complete